jgi:hypothetical protein
LHGQMELPGVATALKLSAAGSLELLWGRCARVLLGSRD